ncbi:hypothetical protein Tsubulata_043907 [Turnera subulata]|uniref:CCHC-type domain-containing protein n=1 Tax=Turnera subulata TaxID=218843 RepID=A0A9Q0FDW6_9ROSI|nr:hypothetical protein Tsubulata_043907 [Turnera subulata]
MSSHLSLVLKTEPPEHTSDPLGASLSAKALEISITVLVGRLVSIRGFSPQAVKSHVMKLWRVKGRLDVIHKGFNLFLFVFESEAELQNVFIYAPWSIFNAHLVVKKWPPHLTWEQVDVGKSCFWVQIHSLPLGQLNESNAKKVGDLFSGMLEFEMKVDNPLNSTGFMTIKTEFWVDKPLISGFTNIIAEDCQPWVSFKYESLTETCWFCGRLGHPLSKCWFKREEEKLPTYENQEMGFGPWLKAETPLHRQYVLEARLETSVTEPPSTAAGPAAPTKKDHTMSKMWVPRRNMDRSKSDTESESHVPQSKEDLHASGHEETQPEPRDPFCSNPTDILGGVTKKVTSDNADVHSRNHPIPLFVATGCVMENSGYSVSENNGKKRRVTKGGGPTSKKRKFGLGCSNMTPTNTPAQTLTIQQTKNPVPPQTLVSPLAQGSTSGRGWKARARASSSPLSQFPLDTREETSDAGSIEEVQTEKIHGIHQEETITDLQAAVVESQPRSQQ